MLEVLPRNLRHGAGYAMGHWLGFAGDLYFDLTEFLLSTVVTMGRSAWAIKYGFLLKT